MSRTPSLSDTCYCDRTGIDLVELVDDAIAAAPRSVGEATVLVVFGSRSIGAAAATVRDQATQLVSQLRDHDALPQPSAIDLIVSGGADGADAVGEAVAVLLDIPALVVPVDAAGDSTRARSDFCSAAFETAVVTTYEGPDGDPASGRGAYLTRDCVMAAIAGRADTGAAVGLWDGSSNGTQHMADSCRSHGVEPVILDAGAVLP